MRPTSPVVLIVDGQQDSLAMYAFGLLAMGFQPLTAETADEGFARACEHRPEVVVAELDSGGGAGADLARRLRQDPRTKELAIIGLAAEGPGMPQWTPVKDVYDRVLLKPCLPDALALTIRDVIVERRRKR